MIDIEKTNLLKNRVQQEKQEAIKNEQTNEFNNKLDLLINSITITLSFYGSQWFILTKFHTSPLNFSESLLILISVFSILNYKK